MDTRHQVDQYMVVGIQLILIVVTGACIHASSTSDEVSQIVLFTLRKGCNEGIYVSTNGIYLSK